MEVLRFEQLDPDEQDQVCRDLALYVLWLTAALVWGYYNVNGLDLNIAYYFIAVMFAGFFFGTD